MSRYNEDGFKNISDAAVGAAWDVSGGGKLSVTPRSRLHKLLHLQQVVQRCFYHYIIVRHFPQVCNIFYGRLGLGFSVWGF